MASPRTAKRKAQRRASKRRRRSGSGPSVSASVLDAILRAYCVDSDLVARLHETSMLYDRMNRGASHVEGRPYTYAIRTSRK